MRVPSFDPVIPKLLPLLGLAMAGCASSPTLRAAEQGRFEGLRDALGAEIARGALHAGEAARFARAVTRGELSRATGEDGVKRVRELKICAREIDGVLDERADKRDAVGAAAALLRVEAGLASAGRHARWAHTAPDAGEASWRPLGARALVSGDDGPLRRQLIADPDEEVRRNALHAAVSSGDPADAEVILDAARVDPYPAARAEAIRAAGVLGGLRVVTALKDLWPRADTPVREAIVDAWGNPHTFNSGGREELEWVVGTQRGTPAINAAGLLIRTGGPGAGDAEGALERAIQDGPSADRVHAIEVAPYRHPSLREAIVKAEADHDEAVAAAAMARRLQAPADVKGAPPGSPDREALVAKLLPIATGTGAGAVVARAALSRARVPQVVPILEKNGSAKDAATRIEAGQDLAYAGDLPRAALVAADLDPAVRVPVACAILHAEAGNGPSEGAGATIVP
jgi:hypothetical protein